jgi:UDP-glucose 4-epimerase
MTILVIGSAGHLGEALMRVLRGSNRSALGIDIKPSPYTDLVGSICDREFLDGVFRRGVRSVIHAAALHKPHVVTHFRQEFVDANITGTLCLLEIAADYGVGSFVFTSTTSAFGSALTPAPGAPATWIDEEVIPIPKNIYGATKLGAEHLCEMFAHHRKLPLVILRTSRFFPEEDDNASVRNRFSLDNAQLNELLYRRADLDDIVQAHLLALERAPELRFGRYIISAPTPFRRGDLAQLRREPETVVRRLFPSAAQVYAGRGWSMFPEIDRVYVSERAVAELRWRPRWDFAWALRLLQNGEDFRSPLARAVGSKGYHAVKFREGPYPVKA